MNKSFEYLSLNIIVVSLFVTVNTHCMLLKNIKKIPTSSLINKRGHRINAPSKEEREYAEQKVGALKLFLASKNCENLKEFTLDLGEDKEKKLISLYTFTVRVANNQEYSAAQYAARSNILSDDHTIKEAALKLYIELVKKNQIPPETTKVATTYIASFKDFLRHEAENLFLALLKKNHAFEEAEQVAANGIKEDIHYIRDSSLILFRHLFTHNRAFESATVNANHAFSQRDNFKRKSALELFEALAEKNHISEAAIKAATVGKTYGWPAKEVASRLFNLIIKKSNETKS